MKETLIEFTTAKLAKEKGFDWECNAAYVDLRPYADEIRDKETMYLYAQNHNEKSYRWSCPSQSVLQRWLREIHSIHLHIWRSIESEKWACDLYNMNTQEEGYCAGIMTNPFELSGYDTYEQALEAGLVKGLEGI